MNAGALWPTFNPNDVAGVRNKPSKMIMAKVMRLGIFIISSFIV
jgi:hypothetical protein